MKKCMFCKKRATCCTLVNDGSIPENPEHEGTQADHRRIIVQHACDKHAINIGVARITTKLK
jgi:hypothetical protein